MPRNHKTEMNKRKKQTHEQEKEAWKRDGWSFIFNFYSEQLWIQRSESPEIVQKCLLWESKRKCQNEASLGSLLTCSSAFFLFPH